MDVSQSMTKMWSGLQSRHSQRKGRSALMISCEAELQDLMRELDIMVQKKDAQWEDRYNMLQTDLDMKANELRIAQDTLEHRNKEVSQLRYSIQGLDTDNANKLAKYEGEVTQLRKQLINLKRCYEKLQKKHKRDYNKLELNNSQSETALQDSMAEVQRLSDKVEEYKSKTRDWNTERSSFQTQITNLESQRKTLADKCELIKHQSHMYKTQLENRRDLLDSTEMTLRAQVTQLEGQIQRDKDTMNYQEEKIKQLKKQLQECDSSLRQTRCIKDRIHEELEEVSVNRGRFEDESNNLSREVKYYRENFRTSKQRCEEMERQMVELKQKLREKSTQLNKLDETNSLQESEQVRKLLTDLQNVQMNNFTLQEQQKTLVTDVERMTDQIARSEAEVCRLSESLRKKNEERNIDSRDARQYEAEVCRLRAKLESMEDSHDSQVDGMKVQMSNITEELHQRNTAFSNLSDKLAHTEFQYKQEVMKHQKDISDFELTKAQLDALRHENKHLKQAIISQQETANDVGKFENMLKKLESEYNKAVEKLQNENKKLKRDLDEIMFEKSVGGKTSPRNRPCSRTRQFNNSATWNENQPPDSNVPMNEDQRQSNNNASFPKMDLPYRHQQYSPWLNEVGSSNMSPIRASSTGGIENRTFESPRFTGQFNNSNNNAQTWQQDVQTSPMSSCKENIQTLSQGQGHSQGQTLSQGQDYSQNQGEGGSQHLSPLSGVDNLSHSQPSIADSHLNMSAINSPLETPDKVESSTHLLPVMLPPPQTSSSFSSSSFNIDQQMSAAGRESVGSLYNGRPSSRASISGQFLAEENVRANDLQRNIDMLIDDFEQHNASKLLSED